MTNAEEIRAVVQQAIDAGATTVEEVHQKIAAMPLEALKRFDSTGTAEKAQDLTTRSIGTVYDTIRQINEQIGDFAQQVLAGATSATS
ncbi:MAG TPA: hypothetical protein VGO87_08715 [Acidimicrobiia bacterium]|jgi:hypothetical protein